MNRENLNKLATKMQAKNVRKLQNYSANNMFFKYWKRTQKKSYKFLCLKFLKHGQTNTIANSSESLPSGISSQ